MIIDFFAFVGFCSVMYFMYKIMTEILFYYVKKDTKQKNNVEVVKVTETKPKETKIQPKTTKTTKPTETKTKPKTTPVKSNKTTTKQIKPKTITKK